MLIKKYFKRSTNLNFFLLLSLFFYSIGYSQTIPSKYFGINGWMSDNIGQSGDPGPGLTPAVSISPSGDLYTIMGTPGSPNLGNVVELMGIKFMRYGGITNDVNFPTFDPTGTTDMQFEKFVKVARDIGAEPIIQVPFLWQWLQMSSSSSAASAASNGTYQSKVTALVNRLKAAPFNVKYWSIGNEPDQYHGTQFNSRNNGNALSAADIKGYFSILSPLIKTADPSAIIVGPDLSHSNAYASTGLAADLIKSTSADNIVSYIDIWTFHTYPHDGTQGRPAVITQPVSGFESSLTWLRNYILNSSNVNLPIAITEFNVSSDNDGPSNNQPNGVGDQNCNSFLAGQWMAEMFAIGLKPTTSPAKVVFMIPWSIHESSGNGGQRDLGILNGTSHAPRSTYHHIKMMAKNFIQFDNFVMGSTNGDGNFKAFSARNCNRVAIMIMNQYQTSKTIDVSFTNAYTSIGTNKIKLNIGNALPFTTTMAAEETRLFIFDPCGRLLDTQVYNESTASTNGSPSTNPQTVNLSCRCMKRSVISNPKLRCAAPTETGSAHYNSATLSSDLTIADSAYITGTLIVPKRVSLTINSAEVSLSSGAQIVVQDGGTLTINNSYLHACPNSTWRGIRVSGSNSGDQFLVSQSFIQDADTAVYTIQINNVSLTENVFENGNVGVLMRKSEGFNISSNEFLNNSKCIQTIQSDSVTSYISENLFYQADTALRFTDDLHQYLDITCNAFVYYKTYGIYSTDGLLKNQGTSTDGPGNQFVTNSVLTNHQLHFTGHYGMNYYCDPSYTFTLDTRSETAVASAAENDGTCDHLDARLANHNINRENFASSRSLSSLINCVPNPVSDKTRFNYTLENNVKTAEIKISNLFGEIINRLPLSLDSKAVEANVSSFNNGIYFYTLYVNGAMIDSKKFVISN